MMSSCTPSDGAAFVSEDDKVTLFPGAGGPRLIAETKPEPVSYVPKLLSASRRGEKIVFRSTLGGVVHVQVFSPDGIMFMQNAETTITPTPVPGTPPQPPVSFSCTALWFNGMVFGMHPPFVVWALPDVVLKAMGDLGFTGEPGGEISFDQ